MRINEFKLKDGFKYLFGQTVHEFVFNERMQKALHLLTETKMEIKKISDACGYKSYSHFSAAFKRKFGYYASNIKHKAL